MIISNLVKKDKLREVQSNTLKELRTALECSFGPMGSNSCIRLDKSANQYSKDGHTILKNIHYNGFIEEAVKEDIESITRYLTTTVGDGTTSAVILSQILFESLVKLEDETKLSPFQLVRDFKKAVNCIKEDVLARAHECKPEDIYNIAMISTNGNTEIAENLFDIYTEHGMEVFIDVTISNSVDSQLKIYDGMTLEAGFADPCFINNVETNTSTIRKPHIYVFEDPIDTPEMIAFFDSILANNIVGPCNNNDMKAIVPTVILTPKISKDMSAYMDNLSNIMTNVSPSERLPINIITNINQVDEFMDIAKLCEAKTIKKYIDPKIQEADVTAGRAPTLDNVHKFYGICDEVVSDSVRTKFINPKNMYNNDGSNSDSYNGLLTFLESAIKKAKEEGEDNTHVGHLKRRLNSLKANMVEYLVGGVTMSDRDSVRDLVEDAVLNCRSAALNGVGYGANYEALIVSHNIVDNLPGAGIAIDSIEAHIAVIIANAYFNLAEALYTTTLSKDYADTEINKMIKTECGPLNIATMQYDKKVLSSIESDSVILDTISKIVPLMFTCNQFIVPTPMHNVYVAD